MQASNETQIVVVVLAEGIFCRSLTAAFIQTLEVDADSRVTKQLQPQLLSGDNFLVETELTTHSFSTIHWTNFPDTANES